MEYVPKHILIHRGMSPITINVYGGSVFLTRCYISPFLLYIENIFLYFMSVSSNIMPLLRIHVLTASPLIFEFGFKTP